VTGSIEVARHSSFPTLNQELTVLGLSRKVFGACICIGLASFNAFGAILPSVGLFLILFVLARIGQKVDPLFLQIVLNRGKLSARYDPGKVTTQRAER
jgi:hypothetical protein